MWEWAGSTGGIRALGYMVRSAYTFLGRERGRAGGHELVPAELGQMTSIVEEDKSGSTRLRPAGVFRASHVSFRVLCMFLVGVSNT